MCYNNNNFPPFSQWAYNPQYMNPQAYMQYQAQIQAYEQQQSYEVANAAYKLKEYFEAARKVDNNHGAELFAACFVVIAKEMNWNR